MVRGKSGRMYATDEYDRAQHGSGPEVAAMKADMDRSDLTDVDLQQALVDEMHDCPECRAAMAAGERPQTGTHAELEALIRALQALPRPKRVRWRDQKRRAR